jgi:hypothetical protein
MMRDWKAGLFLFLEKQMRYHCEHNGIELMDVFAGDEMSLKEGLVVQYTRKMI